MDINSTKFIMTRDINGYNGFGLPFSLQGKKTTLAANVEQHFTVPSAYPKYIAIFSYTPGANIWVDNITTAAVAGGAFTDSTAQLNPAAREVSAGSTLSFITADITTPYVQVSLYVAPPYTN